jgi:hypothetical protein
VYKILQESVGVASAWRKDDCLSTLCRKVEEPSEPSKRWERMWSKDSYSIMETRTARTARIYVLSS